MNNSRNMVMFVSPTNIYPTEKIRSINVDKVEEYKDKIMHGAILRPVELIKADESLFIFDGHHRVIAYNHCGIKHINAVLICQNEELLPMNVSAKDYITVSLSDIYDWEDANRFVFDYYPDIIKDNR